MGNKLKFYEQEFHLIQQTSPSEIFTKKDFTQNFNINVKLFFTTVTLTLGLQQQQNDVSYSVISISGTLSTYQPPKV